MIDTGELLTIAELAVALAGFSALVTVLGTRAVGSDPRLDAFGLRALVEISLLVAALSLFPLIPHKLAVPDETVWRISSVVYLFARAAGSFFSLRRFRNIKHLADSVHKAAQLWIIWPLVLLSYAALLAVAIGLFPSANSALYFAALYMDLVMAGVLFIQVVSSILKAPTE